MGSSGGLVRALGPGTPLTRLGLCRLSVEFLAVTNVPRLYNRAHCADSYDDEVGSSMTCARLTCARLVFKPTFESYRR